MIGGVLRIIRDVYSSFSALSRRNKARLDYSRTKRPRLEPLEDRRLLAGTHVVFDPSTSTVYIGGTTGADNVLVANSFPGTIQVRFEASDGVEDVSFAAAAVSRIVLVADSGDDRFENRTSVPAQVSGGLGNDLLIGGSGDDQLNGNAGNDKILGLGGKDTLIGEDGNDELYGGDADDSLFGGNGDDMLRGELGNDILWGYVGNDTIYGDDGNDQLNGEDGRDVMAGGLGNDQLNGNLGDDVAYGDAGIDMLVGEDGNDELYGGDADDTLFGGNGDDLLRGGSGNDALWGHAGNDTIYGDDGDDQVNGGDGKELMIGGLGNDQLNGNADNDVAWGEAGVDTLIGEDGNDQLYGGDADDTLSGGNDDDYLRGGWGIDNLWGHAGNDTLLGDEGADAAYGGDGNDLFYGGDGNDQLNGNLGNDIAYGDAGIDMLVGEDGNDELYGGDADDTLFGGNGDDLLRGGSGNDALWGHAGNDTIYGDDGDDQVNGGDGKELMIGGLGNDQLNGNADNDVAWGEAGVDTLIGEDGNDQLYGGDADDTLSGGNDDDYLRGGWGIDNLWGHAGNDTLLGDEGADAAYGGDGNDLFYGGDGNDQLNGNLGNDIAYGDAGIDMLVGEDGNDELYGGDADDTLFGGNGDDLLRGGSGNDALWGHAGNDTIYGDDGDDQVNGGDGKELMIGGLGNDQLNGNADNDVAWGEAGVDTLIGEDGNDQLYGGDSDDVLTGGIGSDILRGGSGNDQLSGNTNSDVLFGDDGDDWLDGSEENDWLDGGMGNDWITGNLGDDLLWGRAGADMMIGDVGQDAMVGGDGDDILDGGSGYDILIGSEGKDRLDGNLDDDILIGGSTTYDGDGTALRLLSTEWSGGAPYGDRLQAIQDELFGAHLESGETVLDDKVADTVIGNSGNDWFFLTGVMPVYTPLPYVAPEHGEQGHHHEIIVHELPELEGFELIDSLDKLSDAQSTETITSLIPHAADQLKQKEHLALFELVRYDQVTNIAIRNGSWANPATWQNGVVPATGARVLIPIGFKITVDSIVPARLATIRVDGTLSFSTTTNSELRVDTVIVGGAGLFEMGTAAQPIAAGVGARLLITDNGPIDRSWDPYGISRGLVSHGAVSIYGSPVSSFHALSGPVLAGATQLRLANAPAGWKVGDSIVVAAAVAGKTQNEQRTITAINGTLVTLHAPLAYNHLPPSTAPDVQVHAAHLTRNAVIESETTIVDRRGHVMFMHTPDVDVNYAGFYKLGRTNKLAPINDPVIDASWHLVAGTGTNPRARYAVHFHRTGSVENGNPSTVHGSVVVDSPGWGFVNHSSYANMTDNVAYDVDGAAFSTEVGDEVGSFVHNIAIGGIGSGELTESRQYIQDFGHEGDGFWFQGGGVTVTDNVAAGNNGNAFIYFTRTFTEAGVPKQFSTSNLLDPSIAGGAPSINVQYVPIRPFERNIGYASAIGLSFRYNLRNAPHSQRSYVSNSTFWNNTSGVEMSYAQNTVLQNLRVVNPLTNIPEWSFGIRSNVVTSDIAYNNLTVIGYNIGIGLPLRGNNVVNGGYYDDKVAFEISTAIAANRAITFNGPITFGTPQLEVYMFTDYDLIRQRPESAFLAGTVTLNYGPYANKRLYSMLQAGTAIPFPNGTTGISAQYVGLTNLQLASLGKTFGGELAPVTAVVLPKIGGLVAP